MYFIDVVNKIEKVKKIQEQFRDFNWLSFFLY